MTRALVLGGAGFVGTAACKELMRRGVETVAAGRKDRPYGTFTSYIAFDRTDEEQLRSALANVRPDVLLDLACFQPADVSAVARNFTGDRYVFVSTGVYPNLNGKRAREDDFVPLDGEPPEAFDYLEGKRWCETILARTRDFPWSVIRPPAVFGPSDHTLRIAAYIQRVADGGPLLVPEETYERQAGLAWVKDIGFGRRMPARTGPIQSARRGMTSTALAASWASNRPRSRMRWPIRWPGTGWRSLRIPATPTGLESWPSPRLNPRAPHALFSTWRSVTAGGRAVKLTPTEYELLRYLALHAGKPVTHTTLLRQVWGEYAIGDMYNTRYVVAQIRKKLGDDPANPRYIVNEPGVGYRLQA